MIAKVLVVHGHGQSPDIIKPKARVFEKVLRRVLKKAFNANEIEFVYLQGAFAAYPDDDSRNYLRIWGRGDPGDLIQGLETSIAYILHALDNKGPFIGMIGFSSGAAMTAIVASLLEKRQPVFDKPWTTNHPQLRFAICCSGFKLTHPDYADLYASGIATPVFLTFGELDTVVSPAQTKSLGELCEKSASFSFFGTHFMPQFGEYNDLNVQLAAFFQNDGLNVT